MGNGGTVSRDALAGGFPPPTPGAGSPAVHVDENDVELFGIRMTSLDFEGVCARIEDHIVTRRPGFIVTPNVNHVCTCERNAQFRAAYRKAFLALPDGMPIIVASRLLGKPLRQKLSGSDMVPALCALAAHRGFSVFFLGGTPGTAEKSAQIMAQKYPGLRVAGVYCPEYGFEKDPAQLEQVDAIVRAAAPDICFVALGSPKQELWMEQHYLAAGAMVYMGVGATFDFISGLVRRAPFIVQQMGFEWLWRVAMEPRRLWRRYLVEDIVFFRIFWRSLVARWRGAAPR